MLILLANSKKRTFRLARPFRSPMRRGFQLIARYCKVAGVRRTSFIVSLAVLLRLVSTTPAVEPKPGADQWLTNASTLPAAYEKISVLTNAFTSLKAEIVAEKLRVSWEPVANFSDAKIIASTGSPGHWPARDWHPYGMRRAGGEWITEIPVDSLDVPIIYFAAARGADGSIVSPMRVVFPGALGLEQPSRIFWPFVEGFEQGLEGWRITDAAELRTGVPSKNGRAALALRVPEGRRTVTVVTTRVQGWFLEEHAATGLALWLRTQRGTATATFTLFANAYSTNQIIARRAGAVGVSAQWTMVVLPFYSFPRIPLGEIDLFSIELTAKSGTEILLDDVQLLGRWRVDL